MSDIVPSGESQAFELLHEKVQKWIWRQNWTELRDIQETSIRAVLEQDRDIVIASATASGKTEAAYLPLASILAGEEERGLGVLNVSPLKALINDQYERLSGLFEEIEAPVYRWHGDVSSTSKHKLLKNPDGVLLITPESLEAIFVRHGSTARRLFEGLKYVVVDELHAFMGTERGRQLQSLLNRVEYAVGRRIPRIALSATLGDLGVACEHLRPGEGSRVQQIVSELGQKEVKIQVRGYVAPSETEETNVLDDDAVASDVMSIQQHLFATLRGGRHIVFANRRIDVETYADLLARHCERERLPNEFWPHHGSLSKTLREDAESALKDEERPATVIATSTLELGIDVGSVNSIAQIGPPSSVASIRQRLGRSGRRGEPAVLRIYVSENPVDVRTSPPDRIHSGLVQSIAVIQLLARRWCETPPPGARHLSTLVQQLLSMIAERGGIRAETAFKILCEAGPFRSVSQDVFVEFLRSLGGHDLIQQPHTGELILGLTGERLVNHYEFYAAFSSPEEYRLVSGTQTLGTLPMTYPLVVDSYIIFAGRRWRVEEVDDEAKVAWLVPAPGGRAPNFGGSGASIDSMIRREMRDIYDDGEVPPYLNGKARQLLDEARSEYHQMGLGETEFARWGSDTFVFPWLGDRALGTLLMLLTLQGERVSVEGPALMLEGRDGEAARRTLRSLDELRAIDPIDLAQPAKDKLREKHHVFLSEGLLDVDYASSRLDLKEVWDWLESLE